VVYAGIQWDQADWIEWITPRVLTDEIEEIPF
jgi:hypothetical protein